MCQFSSRNKTIIIAYWQFNYRNYIEQVSFIADFFSLCWSLFVLISLFVNLDLHSMTRTSHTGFQNNYQFLQEQSFWRRIALYFHCNLLTSCKVNNWFSKRFPLIKEHWNSNYKINNWFNFFVLSHFPVDYP